MRVLISFNVRSVVIFLYYIIAVDYAISSPSGSMRIVFFRGFTELSSGVQAADRYSAHGLKLQHSLVHRNYNLYLATT